jgi:hypothetical protein
LFNHISMHKDVEETVDSLDITWFALSASSSKALKKSTLGR